MEEQSMEEQSMEEQAMEEQAIEEQAMEEQAIDEQSMDDQAMDGLTNEEQTNKPDQLLSDVGTDNLQEINSEIVHQLKHDSTIKIIEIKGNYNKKSNQELRDLCKESGLTMRGNKETLVQRLLDNEIHIDDTFSIKESSPISSHI